MTYLQCHLRKGLLEQTVWLPEDYAVVGKTIKLRASSIDEWVDGWEVVEVYPAKRDDLEHVFEYQFHRDSKSGGNSV